MEDKRLRTSACEDSSSSRSCEMIQLPNSIFAHVAGYLAKPSVAMFAVAMTAPSRSWKNIANGHEKISEASREILSSETWEVLNFNQIHDSWVNSTAEHLSDDDIHAILTCINAPSRLKELRLDGCFNVTGRGLVILRGSLVLEKIDLHINGNQGICIYIDGTQVPIRSVRISEDIVLPILDSIVENNESQLSKIQVPREWNPGFLKSEWFFERFSSIVGDHRSVGFKMTRTEQIIEIKRVAPPSALAESELNTIFNS